MSNAGIARGRGGGGGKEGGMEGVSRAEEGRGGWGDGGGNEGG